MATSGIILLAEDDRKLRKLYYDTLTASGYSVVTASDGAEALKLLHKVKPKLILLDVMMPNLNGIETCRRARKMIGTEVPIVFLTALDQVGNLHDCIAAGGDDYIVKSEGVATIIQRVGHWMRHTPAPKPLATRRDKMLVEVSAVLNREVGASLLSSQTDECVREISEFLKVARANATDDFGQTEKQKLYFFGYATGVVEHWAQLRSSLKDQFYDYLAAVLRESSVLADYEVSQMVSGFDELSADTFFGIARAHGRNDPAQRQSKGKDYTPVGLRLFGLVTQP